MLDVMRCVSVFGRVFPMRAAANPSNADRAARFSIRYAFLRIDAPSAHYVMRNNNSRIHPMYSQSVILPTF